MDGIKNRHQTHRYMKKILVILSAMLLTIGAQAQNQMRGRAMEPKEQATRQMQRIHEICKTSAEQDSAMYKLFLADANEMKAMRDSLRAAGQQGQGQRMNFNRGDWQKRQEKTQAALKAILSAEQFEAYDKSVKEMMQRWGQRGGQR